MAHNHQRQGETAKKERPIAPENPDFGFVADVKARELRFDEVPDTEVRFWGDAERDSFSGTERENLPEEVQPGVTYRNVSVRLKIASELVGSESQIFEGTKGGVGVNV